MKLRKHAVIVAISLSAIIGLAGCGTASSSDHLSPAPVPTSTVSAEAGDLPSQDVLTERDGGLGGNPSAVVSNGGFGELPEDFKAPELPYEGSADYGDLTVSSDGFGDLPEN